MGTVWLATQPSLHRDVALKLMTPAIASDPDFVARFQREARTAAQLNHPHIVRVFEIGNHEGLWFLAMEYVAGEPLNQVITSAGSVEPRQAARWGSEVAGALVAAHEHAILHRDVKPSNVLIDRWRHARLMDFGIAKSLDATALTTNAVMGTPNYMAPELGRGESATGRTDQYALGVMLYELVTGQLPYKGETPVSVLYQHMHGDPPAIAELNPHVPAPLIEVIVRAMAREPQDRFYSCADLATSLKAISEGKPPPMLPASGGNPHDETIVTGGVQQRAHATAPTLHGPPVAVARPRPTADRSPSGAPARTFRVVGIVMLVLLLGVALLVGFDAYGRRIGRGVLPAALRGVWSALLSPGSPPPEPPVESEAPSASEPPATPEPTDRESPAVAAVEPEPPPEPPPDPLPESVPEPELASGLPWLVGAADTLGRRGGFAEEFRGPEVLLQAPEVRGTARAALADGVLRVDVAAESHWQALSLRPVPLAEFEATVTLESGAGEAGLVLRSPRTGDAFVIAVTGEGAVIVSRVREGEPRTEMGRRTLPDAWWGTPVRLTVVNRVAGIQVQANGVTVAAWMRRHPLVGYAGLMVNGPAVAAFDGMVVRERDRLPPGGRRLPLRPPGGKLPAR